MFSGIVEEVGTVIEVDRGRLRIGSRKCLRGTNLGDSIAVNGVDLTAAYLDEESFHFNVMQETYTRSNLSDLQPGDGVNLERSLTLSSRISGHLVRGIAEATGTLLSLTPEEAGPSASGNAIVARYRTPAEILRYIVMKGPITVDGVSLTVMARDETSFGVSLVEYTQGNTNLVRRRPGERVNLETDIIAHYVEQLLLEREQA